MEDIVVVAGRVCTNPVLVYAGHLEGRLLVLSLLGCKGCCPDNHAGCKRSVRFRSSSARSALRAARMKMTSAFASHVVNYYCNCSIATGSNVLNTD